MNEQELERRYRSVVEGNEPVAPASLHRYLHSLPEGGPRRSRNPLRALGAVVGIGRSPRLATVAGVALAVVVALGLTGVWLSLRYGVNPAHPSPTPTPTPTAGPTRTPFESGGLMWHGDPAANEPLPAQAVRLSDGEYLGISPVGSGPGLIASDDGVHWTYVPREQISVGADVVFESIAASENEVVLVGTAGTRAIAYRSEDGKTWSSASIEGDAAVSRPMRTVAYMPGAYLALGWDKSDDPEDSPTTQWTSVDGGRTWKQRPGATTHGEALLHGTKKGFVVSGQAIDWTPFQTWLVSVSNSSVTWTQATIAGEEKNAFGMLTLASIAALPDGTIVAATERTNSVGTTSLVASTNGTDWSIVEPTIEGSTYCRFLSLAVVGETLVAAEPGATTIFTSGDLNETDWTMTWHALDAGAGPGPIGIRVVQASDSALAVGDATHPAGTWVAENSFP